MRIVEIVEARITPTEDEMLAVAKRSSESDFVAHYSPKWQREPRTHWQAYDTAGQAIASFGEERVAKYRDQGYEVKKLVPSRQAITAYQRYQQQINALHSKFHAWAKAGQLSEWWGFDPKEVTIYHHRGSDTFTAQWKHKRIGILYLDPYQKDDPPDIRRVHNVAVDPMARRSGIATQLYNAADQYLAQQNQRLAPSKIQHPDGAAFWRQGAHPRQSREIIRESLVDELTSLKQQDAVLLKQWYAIIAAKPAEGSPDLAAFWNDPERGKLWFDQIRPLQAQMAALTAEITKQARVKTLNNRKSNGGFDTDEILYHGTNVEFERFDRAKARSAAHIYTSPDQATAEQYGKNVYAVYGRQQPQAVLTAEDCDYMVLRRVYKHGGFKRHWELSFDELNELITDGHLYNYANSSSLQDDVISTCFSLKFRSVRISDGVPGGHGFSDSVIFDKPEDLQIVEKLTVT